MTVGCARTCRQQAEKGNCDSELHNLRARGVGPLFRIRPAGYAAASLDPGMTPFPAYPTARFDLDLGERRKTNLGRTIE
jgi:hypothetical protein